MPNEATVILLNRPSMPKILGVDCPSPRSQRFPRHQALRILPRFRSLPWLLVGLLECWLVDSHACAVFIGATYAYVVIHLPTGSIEARGISLSQQI